MVEVWIWVWRLALQSSDQTVLLTQGQAPQRFRPTSGYPQVSELRTRPNVQERNLPHFTALYPVSE